jgi:hypothetical protein
MTFTQKKGTTDLIMRNHNFIKRKKNINLLKETLAIVFIQNKNMYFINKKVQFRSKAILKITKN